MVATSGRTVTLQASPVLNRASKRHLMRPKRVSTAIQPFASWISFTSPAIRLLMPMKSATKGFSGLW